MNKIIKNILSAGLLCLIIFMLLNPSQAIAETQKSVLLCTDVLIPSLFPFFVCSNLFISLGFAETLSKYLSIIMKPLFNLSGSCALPMLLGIISGYPTGAVVTTQLYKSGKCTKIEAEHLLTFCNNSGPMFIIGALGIGILGSFEIGLFLYLIHLISSLITGFLFKYFLRSASLSPLSLPAKKSDNIENTFSAIGNSISDSIFSILKVCGFVIFFSTIGATLPKDNGGRYIYAILEITGGIKAIAEQNLSLGFSLPFISCLLAFSGLSVMAQVSAFVLPSGLSMESYIYGKLVHSFIAFLLTYLALKFIPLPLPVFAKQVATYESSFALPLKNVMVILFFILLYFFRHPIYNLFVDTKD